MKTYIIWLIGVILWNFGFPNAIPIADVVAAIGVAIVIATCVAVSTFVVTIAGVIAVACWPRAGRT